jgi:glycosyltransferase involved in cell wall biosynthesis
VTTDVGNAALIVGDTGWVVPPRNPQALAEALAQALTAQDDRAAWATRQQRCRERIAKNYSIEAMVQQYREVWQEVRTALAGHEA